MQIWRLLIEGFVSLSPWVQILQIIQFRQLPLQPNHHYWVL